MEESITTKEVKTCYVCDGDDETVENLIFVLGENDGAWVHPTCQQETESDNKI